MNRHATELLERIRNREALVGVIGLGYVGLPLALAFAESGSRVLGFDTDSSKTDRLNRGESYIDHIDSDRIRQALAGGTLTATSDPSRLEDPDVLVICVPTPLTPSNEPDMTYVVETTEAIAQCLRLGQLVVLESTTYPGTTEEVLLSTLEQSGLKCGRDFFLAYSPEREDPGNPTYTTTSIPKVVGGVDPLSGDLAEALYEGIVDAVVRVSSTRVAEAAKLTENIFRGVNIALVNELKMVYDKMGIDIWEVLDAAESKPFGFMRFNPGPGWGGHCIPVDPFYLSWKAKQFGAKPRFIELAGEINVAMPKYVIEKLEEALKERGETLEGSRILILGIAYKKDVADPRESPAFEIIDHLLQRGATVSYHDPHIPVAPSMRSWPDLPPMESVDLTPQSLQQKDAVILVTDHSNIDQNLLIENAPLIIDTRGCLDDESQRIVRA
jgi:UDP-N-acetyl-D-glucosamine dehydrogenase